MQKARLHSNDVVMHCLQACLVQDEAVACKDSSPLSRMRWRPRNLGNLWAQKKMNQSNARCRDSHWWLCCQQFSALLDCQAWTWSGLQILDWAPMKNINLGELCLHLLDKILWAREWPSMSRTKVPFQNNQCPWQSDQNVASRHWMQFIKSWRMPPVGLCVALVEAAGIKIWLQRLGQQPLLMWGSVICWLLGLDQCRRNFGLAILGQSLVQIRTAIWHLLAYFCALLRLWIFPLAPTQLSGSHVPVC